MNTGYYIIDAATKEAPLTIRWNGNPVLFLDSQNKRDDWYNEYQKIIKEVAQIFV